MDYGTYLQAAMALVFVVGLIGLVSVLARRAGMGFPMTANRGGARRLKVIEVVPVDGRRRLVLIRRDDIGHLLLLGANSETVVETGIPMPAESSASSELPNNATDPRNPR